MATCQNISSVLADYITVYRNTTTTIITTFVRIITQYAKYVYFKFYKCLQNASG